MSDFEGRFKAAVADRYTVRRELGRGGMAVVYAADDLRHSRRVAIKVFQPEIAGSIGAERFLREIQASAQLNHPHILPLHDSGEADGLLYYVMPLVEGETLRQRIDRSGPLSVEEATTVTREVADGLGYAHARGLAHRDIKPENIMLSSGHAVIMDFGICRAMGQADAGDGLTRAGLTLGTPAYMSPEQWSAPERADGRSDIYSLGCVLYEMLLGEPPFSGATASVLLARHTQQEVPSLRIVRPDLPAPLDAVVRRAMAKVPAERYASAPEMAAALAEAMRAGVHAAAAAAPPAVARRTPRLTPRIGVTIAAALLVMPAIYGAYAVMHTEGVPAASERVRILVLPFENYGAPDRAYLADGVTDEVTSRLSSIDDLAVIARTSAQQYRASTKSIREIGSELDVSFVVEGSVSCSCAPGQPPAADDTLRISARLIDVSKETQIWADEYPAVLADVFTIQAEITRRVANALNLAVGESAQRRLATIPTTNLEAWDFFLRGNNYYTRSWQRTDVETALHMYRQAVELDPSFALAHAQMARTHSWLYRLGYDTTEAGLVTAEKSAQRAVDLDPELPEAHVAYGLYHYWGRWDYDAAIGELMIARGLQPGNAVVHLNIGNIRRRQGRWQEAIQAYEAAAELDPRAHIIWYNLGETHNYLRNYAQAEQYLERVSVIAPDFLEAYLERASVALKSAGDTAVARSFMQQAVDRIPPAQWRPMPELWLMGIARLTLGRMPEVVDGLAPGRYGVDSATFVLLTAESHRRDGRIDEARRSYEAAAAMLENAAHSPDASPAALVRLGLAYAGLGRGPEAVELAEEAVRRLQNDEFDRLDMVIALARVHMETGNLDAAIDNLGRALAVPSRTSAPLIRIDPRWQPLRSHPGYELMLRSAERGVIAQAPADTRSRAAR